MRWFLAIMLTYAVVGSVTMCTLGVRTQYPSGPSASAPLPPRDAVRNPPARSGSVDEFNRDERERTESIIRRLRELRDDAAQPPHSENLALPPPSAYEVLSW